MLMYAVCLVFKAHPDAWLSQESFAAKYFVYDLKHFMYATERLIRQEERLRAGLPEGAVAENVLLRDKMVKALKERIAAFEKKRAVARMTALADPTKFSRKYGRDLPLPPPPADR
jgi:hypothetical protein